MKVEKDGLTITYENFVELLDEGDSFTTSLVDILVKVRSAISRFCVRGFTTGYNRR